MVPSARIVAGMTRSGVAAWNPLGSSPVRLVVGWSSVMDDGDEPIDAELAGRTRRRLRGTLCAAREVARPDP